MIKRNIDLLRKGKYHFIIGGRIKKQGAAVNEWLMPLPHEDGKFYENLLENGERVLL